jgi:hypothetical protein
LAPAPEIVRLSPDRVQEIDDPRLIELDNMVRLEESLSAAAGEEEGEEPEDDVPVDLELVAPRAADLRVVFERAQKPLPPQVVGALGPRVPILLYHGFTPFPREGNPPRGVLAFGYTATLKGSDAAYAATVGVIPDSEFTKYAALDEDVRIGISAGGEVGIPQEVFAAVNAVPGISFKGARLEATTDTKFAVAIHLNFGLMSVVAAPVGAGGARWELYRRGEKLQRFQPLVQTILVTEGTSSLTFEVETWIRRRRRLLARARHWHLPLATFSVSLGGL